MQLIKTLYVSIAAVILFASCSSDDDTRDFVSMPVTLTIPVTDEPVTRAGDPGTYEQFKLPHYAYIYIVCQDAEGRDVVVGSTPTLTDGWTKTTYAGPLATAGDSVYQYNGHIEVYLPIERTATGRVYVALSAVPLPGLPTGQEVYSNSYTETDVQNFAFTLNDDTRKELANVYSTPYNYRTDGAHYYGTMNDFNTLTPNLNIVLYHVAAKLDLSWNVDPQLQSTTAIKTLTLSLPDAGSAYIFRPLDTTPTTTYSYPIDITPGNQWYGRSYTYVIQMSSTNNYTFGATVGTNNGATRTNSSISAGTFDKAQPFTSWMRGTITVR